MISTEPTTGKLPSWIALALLLTPLLIVAARAVLSGTPDLAVEGDLAMLNISTRNLAEGRSLLGPYSRFGFNHPGPAYLFIRMPFFLITRGSGSASYITVPLLITVSLSAAFMLFRRFCGTTLSIVFCLLILLYLVQTSPVVWLQDWNPFVIIFPFLLLVAACAAVASGGTGWFPAAVICGSLVAQTHLGSAPVVLALLLVIVPVNWLFAPVVRGKGSRPGRHIVAGLVLGVALWLPVLVQELAPGEGNVARIIRFMGENPSGVGFKDALREWSGALTSSEMGLLAPRFLRSRGILFQVVFVIALLRLFFLAVCAVMLRKTGKSPFTGSLAVLLIVAHIAMLFGVMEVRGDLHEYLFCWFSVTSPLSWLVFIGSLAVFVPGKAFRFRALLPILILLMVPPVFSLVKRLGALDTGVFDPMGYNDERVERLSTDLEAFLADHDGRSFIIEPDPRELWPVSAGVVNRLSGRGFDIHPDPFFGTLLGTAVPEAAIPLVLTATGSRSMSLDTVSTHDELILGLPGGSM